MLTDQFNPLTGQGGNGALESAACLSDLLADVLKETNGRPELHSLQQAFSIFRDTRGPRAAELMSDADGLQKLESLDNPVARFLNLNVLSRFETVDLLQRFALSVLPGRSLRQLTAPKRLGLLKYQENLRVKPNERPMVSTVIATSMLGLAALLHYMFPNKSPTAPSMFDFLDFYSYVSKVAVNLIWIIEASRPMALLTPIGRYFSYPLIAREHNY